MTSLKNIKNRRKIVFGAVVKKLKEFKIIKRKIKNKKSAHPRRFPFFILPFDYFEFFQFFDPHPFASVLTARRWSLGVGRWPLAVSCGEFETI